MQVLDHLRAIGYDVDQSDDSLPSDDPGYGTVEILDSQDIAGIKDTILEYKKEHPTHHIGIIGFNASIIEEFKSIHDTATHVMYVDEVQGLEFDAVWVLEHAEIFEPTFDNDDQAFQEAYKALIKDYRYVAYTRAKTHLVRVVFSD